MKKQFRLPKEFAEKWLIALRSGYYHQGSKNLFSNNEYCCIGVAGAVCGVSTTLMDNRGLFSPECNFPMELIPESVPKELIGSVDQPKDSNELVEYLVNMNDGGRVIKKNFKEIADWIEQNCEFY